MPDILVKERVTKLERLMAKLIMTVDQVDKQQAQTQRNLNQLSGEMQEFKKENRIAWERADKERQKDKEANQLAQERADKERQEAKEANRLAEERSDRQIQEIREANRLAEERAEKNRQKIEEANRLAQERVDTEREKAKEENRLAQERHDKAMEKFQQEIKEIKDEMRKETERFLRKMGTLVEDMVAPSIPSIIRQVFGCPKDGIDFFAVRVKRRHPATKQSQEYDVVAIFGDYLFINETKSRLESEDIREFAEETLRAAREFFPEYLGKKIIGAIASFYIDESLVKFGERCGLLVLGFGGDEMVLLNSPGFEPKTF